MDLETRREFSKVTSKIWDLTQDMKTLRASLVNTQNEFDILIKTLNDLKIIEDDKE